MSLKFFRLVGRRFVVGVKFIGRKSRNFNDNNYMRRLWFPSVLALASFLPSTKLSDDGLKKSDGTLRVAPIEAQRFKNPLADFHPMLPGTPKHVLIVDGGGLRGCMSIQILKKLENEIQKIDPDLHLWQMFDFVLGTSTGGLIAIGLGKMHMSCQEIDEFYDEVANRVFKKGFGNSYSTIRGIKQGIKSIVSSSPSVFDTKQLEVVMKELVGEMDMCPKNSNNDQVKCAVLTTMANNPKNAAPVLLRSYVPQKELEFIPKEWSKDREEVETSMKVPDMGYIEFMPAYHFFLAGVSDLKVWEAARATSAAPTYFEALELPMPPHLAKSIILRKLLRLTGVYSEETTGRSDPFWATNTSDKFVPSYLKGLVEHEEALTDILNLIYDLILDKQKSKNDKKYSNKQVDEILKQCVEKYNVLLKKAEKIVKHGVPLNLKVLKKEIYNRDYHLHLQDGGLSGNSPLIHGFVECSRMWPQSDIVMLSVGTGMTSPSNMYEHQDSPLATSLFSSVFGAKEVSGLMQMISYSSTHSTPLSLQRLNPQIDDDKTDMADAKLMKYWREQGTAYAQDQHGALERWAQFLVKGYYNKLDKSLE